MNNSKQTFGQPKGSRDTENHTDKTNTVRICDAREMRKWLLAETREAVGHLKVLGKEMWEL